MAKPKAHLKLVVHDSFDEPFLILSIRDAIAREVADFLDLVPAKEEAQRILMDAIDQGFGIHGERQACRRA